MSVDSRFRESEAAPPMHVEENVELAPLTTMGVGGRARWFAHVREDAQLEEALNLAASRKLRVFVLGGGSNLVAPDEGVDGLVLGMQLRGISVEERGARARVTARAGEPWDAFVERTVALGLGGVECLSGIPGLVGATPIQNVGAYGQEVADTIVEVRVFDRLERRASRISRDACRFGYRESRFKNADRDRYIVTDVTFELERGTPRRRGYAELERALAERGAEPTLPDIRETVIALRRMKSMVLDPRDENGRSCGSFFVNPTVTEALADTIAGRFAPLTMPRYPQQPGWVKLSAAWLIERSGLAKGTRVGNVGISTRHALALTSKAGATATELLAFAAAVQRRVREETGVELTPEPVFW